MKDENGLAHALTQVQPVAGVAWTWYTLVLSRPEVSYAILEKMKGGQGWHLSLSALFLALLESFAL